MKNGKGITSTRFPCWNLRCQNDYEKANIVCRQRKKRKFVNANSQALAAAPNLLKRQFYATAPNRIWLTDITYISTKEGWVYAAVVLDTFSRNIIGLKHFF